MQTAPKMETLKNLQNFEADCQFHLLQHSQIFADYLKIQKIGAHLSIIRWDLKKTCRKITKCKILDRKGRDEKTQMPEHTNKNIVGFHRETFNYKIALVK